MSVDIHVKEKDWADVLLTVTCPHFPWSPIAASIEGGGAYINELAHDKTGTDSFAYRYFCTSSWPWLT